MTFDTSRYRFDPIKDYLGVVMEQGRVQLDSDWNDWQAQFARRMQAGTLDAVGHVGYPATTPSAFMIGFDGTGQLVIGPGRMYVDGLLAENHGDPTTAAWDPVLAEMSNTPLPPPNTLAGAIAFSKQPYLPGAAVPQGATTALAYLDVWTRAVDYLQDPSLIEPAVSVDTTGRLQTVWQVRLAAVAAGTTCANAGTPWPVPSAGLLWTQAVASTPSGPCCLTDDSGYTGSENQHYRIEIHQGGPIGTATFKWSRDNGSVETGVTSITPVTNSVMAQASQLGVLSMGRDRVLGFAPGDWIELLDDGSELAGLPGELHRIDTVDVAMKTITLDAKVDTARFSIASNLHMRIRRWDQSGLVQLSDGNTVDLGAIGSKGDIPVPAANIAVTIESGVAVHFDVSAVGGVFNSGDFWTFAARTDGSFDILTRVPPRGIHHHYTPLAVVDVTNAQARDCRTPWPGPAGSQGCGCCCTVTVGAGGQFARINDALKAVAATGGEVCILPGRYFEHVVVDTMHDIVIRGCGYQTRLASPSLLAGAAAAAPTAEPDGINADGTFGAVVSITASRHVQLRDLCIEADRGEIGVLVDGSGLLVARGGNLGAPVAKQTFSAARPGVVVDVTIEELVITASTLPAILASRVEALRIDDNRILMANVESLWPAIYVQGVEMHVDRNVVGVLGPATANEWLPQTVAGDLMANAPAPAVPAAAAPAAAASAPSASTKSNPRAPARAQATAVPAPAAQQPAAGVFAPASSVMLHQGSILIAGPSRDVFVCENDIAGGRFNGITLGSYAILDTNGVVLHRPIGVRSVPEDPCCKTGTLAPPVPPRSAPPGSRLVSGGDLVDITIDRNRIRDVGLCGIGPIGFFDLAEVAEIIWIRNLTITRNVIQDTVLRGGTRLSLFGAETKAPAAMIDAKSALPYAAIGVPGVENLVVRDNAITNFGARPGVDANGIFVMHGEMVEIARNRVLETRDWTLSSRETLSAAGLLQGGIVVLMVTPPAFANAGTGMKLVNENLFEPGLPALRVEENVVRMALGLALGVLGLGPFEISDNHFATGGTVSDRESVLAHTVLIANDGLPIESAATTSMRELYEQMVGRADGAGAYLGNPQVAARAFAASRNGTVLFSDNVCQLESRANPQRATASLMIFARDHLTFTANHCWVDSTGLVAFCDADILACSVNVSGNRFQESAVSVPMSAAILGAANITSLNISTFCLSVNGVPAWTINQGNVVLSDTGFCAALPKP